MTHASTVGESAPVTLGPIADGLRDLLKKAEWGRSRHVNGLDIDDPNAMFFKYGVLIAAITVALALANAADAHEFHMLPWNK
jgi:hypothetical protein